MMVYVLSLYAVLVVALTAAEVMEKRFAQRVLKPLAALGFLTIAFFSTALLTPYGKIIFAGLLACAVGDIFLLSRKSPKLFLAGMAAFAVGHIAYLTAFIPFRESELFNPDHTLSIAQTLQGCVMTIGAFVVLAWLIPHLPKNMRVVVPLYVIVILLMVMVALGLPMLGAWKFAMIGAILFAVSDIFVARDRFVSPNPKNALAITPLYFGAQALIALSTQAFN